MHLRIAAVVFFVLSTSLGASEFVVNSLDGITPPEGLTFQTALFLANMSPEANVKISFNIAGPGVHVINTGGTFQITRSMLIDGTSQPGYAGTPLIQINGLALPPPSFSANVAGVQAAPQPIKGDVFMVTFPIARSETETAPGVAALEISGFSVDIIGLSITNSSSSGIYFAAGSGHSVEACYIGVAPNGTAGRNGTGIRIGSGASNVRIGTDGNGDGDAAEGNLIGFNGTGVQIESTGLNTIVAGNRIGILPNNTPAGNDFDGIYGYSSSQISILNNVIANNGGTGFYFSSTSQLTVQGNRIVANGFGDEGTSAGIALFNVTKALIGTNGDGINDAAERNVISGNGQFGIFIEAPDSSSNVVDAPAGNLAGLSNVVSLDNTIRIAGNYIGVDSDGTALGNGSFIPEVAGSPAVAARAADFTPQSGGIEIEGPARVIIGSDGDGSAGEAGEGNVISSNTGDGIHAYQNPPQFQFPTASKKALTSGVSSRTEAPLIDLSVDYDRTITGNTIGAAPDKVGVRGNTRDGVRIENGSTLVGYPEDTARNLIVNNGNNGVSVLGSETLTTILSNSISANLALGIDLGDDGVTANDPNFVFPSEGSNPGFTIGDPDFGPNFLSNFPVLTSLSADRKTVSGTLNAEIIDQSEQVLTLAVASRDEAPASSIYRIEFFGNPASSPTQGKTFLGSTDVTVSDHTTFTASFTATLTTQPAPGTTITSTATRMGRYPETSEFSAPLAVPALDFTSTATFTPANPTTDDVVTFMAQASIAGITITFDFGDGSSAVGDTVLHQYSAPGTYNVVVTLLDEPTGTTVSQVLVVPVIAGATPPPPDKPTATNFRIRVLTITLNNAKPNMDTIAFGSVMQLPKDFKLLGQTFDLDVGGVKESFTLNAKGRGKTGIDTVMFTIPKGKRIQDATYSVALKKGSFADILKAGATAKDAKGLPLLITVRAHFNGTDYQRLVPVKFRTSKSKSTTKFGVF